MGQSKKEERKKRKKKKEKESFCFPLLSMWKCELLSRVQLFATPRITACQAPLPWDSLGKNTGVAAVPFYRGSSQPRDGTQVSCIAGRLFTIWATGKTLSSSYIPPRVAEHKPSGVRKKGTQWGAHAKETSRIAPVWTQGSKKHKSNNSDH